MLRKKLNDGTVVGLSLETDQGGILMTLSNDKDGESFQVSMLLNPSQAARLSDSLGAQHCRIQADDGHELVFRSPQTWEGLPIYLELRGDGGEEWIRFPLAECEVRYIRKALDHAALTMLYVGTWHGEPEEL